jgi:zinc/manganese transport system permease protein
MFATFMANTWWVSTVVGVVAGVVGFFVVLRSSSFVAHAVPKSAFAGAAGASLLGVSTTAGLAAFALLGALSIGWLGRRGRHDVVTALSIVLMLGAGALFLSWSDQYAPAVFSLLFGNILGVTSAELLTTVALGVLTLAMLAAIYRPLLLTSVAPEIAVVRGVRPRRVELAFLVLVALVTTTAVPVVGALLMFSLMIGPAAAARSLTSSPPAGVALAALLSLVTIWASIAASFYSDWPIGFFVGVFAAFDYIAARAVSAIISRRVSAPAPVRA